MQHGLSFICIAALVLLVATTVQCQEPRVPQPKKYATSFSTYSIDQRSLVFTARNWVDVDNGMFKQYANQTSGLPSDVNLFYYEKTVRNATLDFREYVVLLFIFLTAIRVIVVFY